MHPLIDGLFLHAQEYAISRMFYSVGRPQHGWFEKPLVFEKLTVDIDGIEEREEEVFKKIAALNPNAIFRHDRVIIQRRHFNPWRHLDVTAFGQLHEEEFHEIERHERLQQTCGDPLCSTSMIASNKRT